MLAVPCVTPPWPSDTSNVKLTTPSKPAAGTYRKEPLAATEMVPLPAWVKLTTVSVPPSASVASFRTPGAGTVRTKSRGLA